MDINLKNNTVPRVPRELAPSVSMITSEVDAAIIPYLKTGKLRLRFPHLARGRGQIQTQALILEPAHLPHARDCLFKFNFLLFIPIVFEGKC